MGNICRTYAGGVLRLRQSGTLHFNVYGFSALRAEKPYTNDWHVPCCRRQNGTCIRLSSFVFRQISILIPHRRLLIDVILTKSYLREGSQCAKLPQQSVGV